MTDRMDEIRERLEAATDGPWVATGWSDYGEEARDVIASTNGYEVERRSIMREADATFIAHAREDVPWLLAEVDAAKGEAARHYITAHEWRERAVTAEAEAATLREVVREVVALRDAWANGPAVGYDRNEQVELDTEKTNARSLTAALGDAPEGDGGGSDLGERLRDRLHKDAEASADRPDWAKRRMPAIEADRSRNA